ncbi:hypothetical protein LshimejAT787_1701310 [Lyophyllum shimeji]|uniref:Uncharacterized protein n=1 Tax=Lyophyllum shimeji TaxID=47721 RepID=A0A9P3PZS7_LYOSH|nr:hypothetical protein LshimejAT787_1701310 [Lyophyllum shimeji]
MAGKVVVFGSVTDADQSHDPSKFNVNGQRAVSHTPSNLNLPYSGFGASSPFASYTYTYGSTSTDPRGVSSSPRLPRSDSGTVLNVVPEDRIMMEFPSTEQARTPLYTGGIPLHDEDDESDSEEEERELDEELEEHGLYRGSYRRLMLLYTLTPLTFLVFFTALALLPPLAYPLSQSWPYPTAPYFPHPIPELLASSALFSLSHLLRTPLTALAALLLPSSPSPLFTALHTLLALFFQQSALPLLLVAQHAPPHPRTRDAAFRRVWWLALGWAAAEAVAAIAQGYAARALYRDVLVSVRRTHNHSTETDVEADACGRSGGQHKSETRAMGPGNGSEEGQGSRSPERRHGRSTVEMFEQEVFSEGDAEEVAGADERQPLLSVNINRKKSAHAQNGNGSEIKMQVEDELDTLIAVRAREELEEAYGVPIIRIPVFLSCLQRINALLFTLGIYLLLAQAYLRSTLATPISPRSQDQEQDQERRTNLLLALAVPLCVLVHYALALLQTPPLLPRVGAPAAVYSASLVSLGVFFGGLAAWEGLS